MLCVAFALGVGLASTASAVPGSATVGASAAPAQAEGGASIGGTLRNPDGTPLADAKVTVLKDGKEVGSATSGADGRWSIAVPTAGSYDVQLDVSTLPGGVHTRVKGGETLEDVAVSEGQQRAVIFPLVPSSTPQQNPSSNATPGSADEKDRSTKHGSATSFVDRALQQIVLGLKLGAIIAITSVGLSLVFGTTRLINFAHGELVTLGAVAAYYFSVSPVNLPLIPAAVIAIGVGVAVAGGMELGIWKRMRARGAGLIQMFIISIGLSLLLRHLILVFFGSRRHQYDQYTLQHAWDWGPISITPRDLTIIIVSVLVLCATGLMLLHTRIGKGMRAVADNSDLAAASGINVDRVILIVWLLGGGLAALGGVLYGLTEAVYWDMGFNLLLLMFAGVILGGLGSAFGAVVGSFVIGLVAQISTLWFASELQNAWALLALIVVLLIRPQGILGRAERAG